MAVNCSPFGPKPQFELSTGPAYGYQLFFYAAGSTSTKQNTYTDSTGSTPNPNPIVLNALGQPTNQIWWTAGQAYKVVYAPAGDTDPPSSPIWTIDNLVGINDTSVTISDWIAGPTPTYTGASTFTLAGDQTSTFHIGRRIKTVNSGGTKYGTITNSVFAALTTVTVANDSGNLDAGLSAVSYGLISAVYPSLPSSAAVHNTMGISAALQKQTYTAFTTGGTSTAYTLTPSPAITANTAGTEFEITFNAAAGATPTLAVSGLAALPLKYRDSTGALQAITSAQVPNGLVSKVYTDGVNWIVLNPVSPGTVITATFKNLKLVASGLTNTSVVITADEVALKDANNAKYTATSVNLTVNSTVSGANGLDTGVLAGSTWYSVWAIYNPATATLAGLLSASSTAPTLPAGYTLSARIGWIRTDGTVNKYLLQTLQLGRRAQYVVLTSSNVPNSPLIASGALGTYSVTAPTWAAVSVSAFVPPTASRIMGRVDSGYNGAGAASYMLAPNNSYLGSSTTNPCPIYFNAGSAASYSVLFDFALESTNLYVAANVGFGLGCMGWEDNI